MVFAVIQTVVCPPEMSRAYLEEQALRKQLKEYVEQQKKEAAAKGTQSESSDKKSDENAAK